MAQNQNSGKKPPPVPLTVVFRPGCMPRVDIGGMSVNGAASVIKTVCHNTPGTWREQAVLTLAILASDPGCPRHLIVDWAHAVWREMMDPEKGGTHVYRKLGFYISGFDEVERRPAEKPIFIQPRHRRLAKPKQGRRAQYDAGTYLDAVDKIVKEATAENSAGLRVN